MKRKIVLLVLLCTFLLTGCSNDSNKTNQVIDDNKPTNETITSKYEHSEFKCDAISSGDDFVFENGYLYSNGSIYELTTNGKIFSNNQNCKKIENVSYDNVVTMRSAYGSNIVIKDNNAYYYSSENYYEVPYQNIKIIALEPEVKSIWYYDIEDNIYYVLKSDGNVYKYILTKDDEDNYEILSSNEIVYSNIDYGNIKYFYYDVSYDKDIINLIIYSDNGLYTMEDVKTPECEKYEDVKCDKRIIQNVEFNKYKDEIIYLNSNIVIDKNMNLYTNNFIEIKYIP